MLLVAGRSGRRIDDELQVWIVIGLETCVPKTQHTLLWMSQALDSAGTASNIMGFPPFCKLRAAVAKARNATNAGSPAQRSWVARNCATIRLASSAQLDPNSRRDPG